MFDFLFDINDGSMASLFAGSRLGVSLVLENSSFAGSFDQDFISTRIKGKAGAITMPVSEPSMLMLFAVGLLTGLRLVRASSHRTV